ncbi:MAG: hypothetical protein R3E13_03875 [Alphaproteobacteria bacterium]
MTRKRSHGSESLKIKLKDDKVHIIFNAQNWDYICTELLIALAIDAEDHDIPVANHMKDALKLKIRDLSPSQKSFDDFMNLCEKLAKAEKSGKYSSGTGNPNIGEPK